MNSFLIFRPLFYILVTIVLIKQKIFVRLQYTTSKNEVGRDKRCKSTYVGHHQTRKGSCGHHCNTLKCFTRGKFLSKGPEPKLYIFLRKLS